MTFLYFAYGSNMLTEWLRDRCPSAQPIGIAIAANHRLVFEKRSIDKSGKATLVRTEGVVTPGVVFEIAEHERPQLDIAEGFKPKKPDDPSRYRRDDNFEIQPVGSDSVITATTYLANKPEDGLKPYDWYLTLLIAGSLQHGIDQNHIDFLTQVAFDKADECSPKPENRYNAICVLHSAGYGNLDDLLLS